MSGAYGNGQSAPFGSGGQPAQFGAGGYGPVPGGQALYGGENIPMNPQGGGYAPPPGGGGYAQPGGYAPQPYPPGAAPPGHYPPPQHGYYPPGQQPITNQPGGWMNMPQGIPDCPRGLEYLASIDQLLVHQKVELLEAFTGFETNNKFTIKNSLGQKVYWAIEDNDCCTRNCCGPRRPFDMKILDSFKNEVMHLNRPLACDSCCCPCCLQSIEVSSPPGTVVGTVEQNWSLCYPDFSIKNAAGETILKIDGPLCRFTMCGDVEFKITTVDGQQVGKISKQWSGLARELFTDSDHFGITFPLDLDVKMKAVCLGAVFLIDIMFFEKAGNREGDGIGMF